MISNLAEAVRHGATALSPAQILFFLFPLATTGCFLWYRRFLSGPDLSWIPRSGTKPGWFGLAKAKRDFIRNGAKIIDDGYQRFRDSMFVVQTADMERVVLSNKYVDEIRAAPESVLSVREGMCDRHIGKYTTLDVILTSHLQNDVCKGQLTQNLDPINQEVRFWLAQQIPPTQTAVSGYGLVLRTVAGVTSRVLVGLPVSRGDEWLETAIGYTLDVFNVSSELRPYPKLLRQFVAPWLASSRRLQAHVETANRHLGPLFAAQLAAASKEKRGPLKSSVGDESETPANMVQWMVDSARGSDRDPKILARKMLFLTLAAVHTSTMSATHALLDLCAMPQYIDPLRAEAHDVLARHGEWTLAAVNDLRLLDSFMKESQRINHPGLLSFNRKVMRPLRLSDGTALPAGTFITMATNSIARDARYYSDPDAFDGFRFFERRRHAPPADAGRHQFVSTGPDSLPFGHGRFACPGRVFAAAQIKLVLANIVLGYDLAFPDGQTARPANIFSGEGIGPDRQQVIVFTPRGKH